LFLSSFQNQVLMIIINSPLAISHDPCWPVIDSFHNFRISVFYFLVCFYLCVLGAAQVININVIKNWVSFRLSIFWVIVANYALG
jgi:hypothetical protein